MLRPCWLRTRRYYGYSAAVALSAAGLAISGCVQKSPSYTADVIDSVNQRLPAARPGNGGAAPGGSLAQARPAPAPGAPISRTPVATATAPARPARGRVHLSEIERVPNGGHYMTPREGAGGFQRRPTSAGATTSDPFLMAQAAAQQSEPRTAPPAGSPPSPATATTARPAVPAAAVASAPKLPQQDLRALPGQSRPPQQPAAAPPQQTAVAQASRLEQLRAELRSQAAPQAVPSTGTPPQGQAPVNDRGIQLSSATPAGQARTGQPPAAQAAAPVRPSQTPVGRAPHVASAAAGGAPEGVVRTSGAKGPAAQLAAIATARHEAPAATSEIAPGKAVVAASAALHSTEAIRPVAATVVETEGEAASPSTEAAPAAAAIDAAVKVQSLLAAAEWQAQQGELQQAYGNAILAQRLMEQERVRLREGDRRPVDVARTIWQQIHENNVTDATHACGVDVASKPKVEIPPNAFPQGFPHGWHAAPPGNGMPFIQPRESNRTPTAKTSAELLATTRAQGSHGLAAPSAETRRDLVSLDAIDDQGPMLAAPGVITADANTPAPSIGGSETGLTVPAMATFPTWGANVVAGGPALTGPALTAPVKIDGLPALDDIVASRPAEAIADSSPSRVPRTLWGVLGVAAGVLISAVLFRRSWSIPSRPQG